jgi:hypothetical protein
MSKRIAIVVGFSERCLPLMKQCVLSLDRNVLSQSPSDIEYFLHAYKCNFKIANANYAKNRLIYSVEKDTFEFETFKNRVDLGELPFNRISVIMEDCSIPSFKKLSPLPDIAIYQDFCDRYLSQKKYDYVLFCHDDVAFFQKTQMIEQMLKILDTDRFNIICRASFNCNDDISIRFHPCFIFVKTSVLERCKLSFVNNKSIFRDGFKSISPYGDGGAGLLNSYYSNDNTDIRRPYTSLPDTWFTHIKTLGDTGVEFSFINFRHKNFDQIMSDAEKYSDLILYE